MSEQKAPRSSVRRGEAGFRDRENLEQVLKWEIVSSRQSTRLEPRHEVGGSLGRLGGDSVSLGTRLCWGGT